MLERFFFLRHHCRRFSNLYWQLQQWFTTSNSTRNKLQGSTHAATKSCFPQRVVAMPEACSSSLQKRYHSKIPPVHKPLALCSLRWKLFTKHANIKDPLRLPDWAFASTRSPVGPEERGQYSSPRPDRHMCTLKFESMCFERPWLLA